MTDYYATNQGNFPGGKNGERRGIPGDVSGQRRKKSDHDATLEEYSFRSGDPVHGGRVLLGQLGR